MDKSEAENALVESLTSLRRTAAGMAADYRRWGELSDGIAGRIDGLTEGVAGTKNARVRAAVRDSSEELIAALGVYRRRLAVQISAIDRYLKIVQTP